MTASLRWLGVALACALTGPVALARQGGGDMANPDGGTGAALAGTDTANIMRTTIGALGSCLAYQVTGVCFFLKCTPFGCSVETSIRIQHYVPDVAISSYNSPKQHPWTDVGKPFAEALAQGGSSMMSSLLDSTANTAREAQEIATFKSTDAIGNPVGAIMAGGGGFEFPDFRELMQFPVVELPRIIQQWATVPVAVGNEILEGARATAMNPGALLADIRNLPDQFAGVMSSMTSQSGINFGGMAGWSTVGENWLGAGGSGGGGGGGGAGGGGGSNSYLCPGDAGLVSIHYNSDLDALFWRGKIPLELLYPASWVPGLSEVGHGLINTWGGTYPRTGELVQSHPVKSSAVLSARVASIIMQEAQPHIYKKLSPKGDKEFVYFDRGVKPKWQAVHPVPSPNCITFGENDSFSLGSFGDYKTSGVDGYIWNLWLRYSCCERKTPIFLFAIP